MNRRAFDRGVVRMAMLAAIVVFGSASDCKNEATGPTADTMFATIDGASWSAATITGTLEGDRLTIRGESTGGESIEITTVATMTGTQTIGGFAGDHLTFVLTDQLTTRSWRAFTANGSGTLTLTRLSATRVSGTFSFTSLPTPGSTASGNRVAASGTFDIGL
jgi:hypothetical protein